LYNYADDNTLSYDNYEKLIAILEKEREDNACLIDIINKWLVVI
jgi:hypothetical protein